MKKTSFIIENGRYIGSSLEEWQKENALPIPCNIYKKQNFHLYFVSVLLVVITLVIITVILFL